MMKRFIVQVLLGAVTYAHASTPPIDRRAIVSRYNPSRNASSTTTPMQVGNGNFAFGADVTGLQTFQPFAIMSSWGWKNDSLPPGKTWADVENYRGASWPNHGRPVEYDFAGPDSDLAIQQWLISNPNRANLGRVGLVFLSGSTSNSAIDTPQVIEVKESDLTDIKQTLDLWTGMITSQFSWSGTPITVQVASSQDSDTIGIKIMSPLLHRGRLGLFLDFPWNDGSAKFSAPFVGNWTAVDLHTTTLTRGGTTSAGQTATSTHVQAEVTHQLVSSVFYTSIGGDPFKITRDSPTLHRYSIFPSNSSTDSFSLSLLYSPNSSFHHTSPHATSAPSVEDPKAVFASSVRGWEDFWTESGFVDVVTGSTDERADELQRRVILSRYLMRVNEAGNDPPQESGLVNNGWYGKFHMEMYFWHSCHWALWGNWDLLHRSTSIYSRFLPTSQSRAAVQQGWPAPAGARWPKMTDPSGRSAPGTINNLLIWQQPHPLIFAEYEWRSSPTNKTLEKWAEIISETAQWMADFAWWNDTTSVFDLGPPMYVVSEDTNPNITQNPAFELAYWKFGMELAEGWLNRLGLDVPAKWGQVKKGLAKLPIGEDGLYQVYEGIEDFWDDPQFTSNHPTLVGLHGWLPQTEGLDLQKAKSTAEKVWTHWNITDCWGWDFPMLAMSAARNGDTSKAIDWLLRPDFQFDDVGMPVGGVQVPTPYFPGAGALLYSVAMMSAGWDRDEPLGVAPGFPRNNRWSVRVEGI
ncbi:hypothetical protein BDN72DRAFT_553410, partial [Pluteus cervinus]